jgi:SAM-dependent methyltransferase
MKVFEGSAAYYDEMYSDKDYVGEVAYVEGLMREFAGPGELSILDLGSGTGKHAVELALRGHSVRGVDRSEQMVGRAEARKSALSEQARAKVGFSVGDVRSVRLGSQFQVVLALFHVASYQTTNQDLKDFLETARLHLRPDGILIFDFWYGPAVLSEQPEVRVKRAETAERWVVRIAEPVTHFEESCVTVKYEIVDCLKKTGAVTKVNEEHKVRFFSLPELHLFAELAGFEILSTREWMKASGPTNRAWSVCIIARPKRSLL